MKLFIIEDDVINSCLNKLFLVEKIDDDTKIYVDENRDVWKLQLLWLESLGINKLVLFNPSKLNFDYLFSILQSSANITEIAAASLNIYFLNFDNNKNNRERLIEYLETNDLNIFFSRKKVTVILNETLLADPTNKDEILSKNYKEIEDDAKFYRDIADRAKMLY